jgi:hypothetical protein
MLQGSVLFDALSSIFWKKKEGREKKKKGKGEIARGFFPRQTHPIGCSMLRYLWLLGTIKSGFKDQYLNFMSTLCVGCY